MTIFFLPIRCCIHNAGLAKLQALDAADNWVICHLSGPHLSPTFWTTIPGAELQAMGNSLNNQRNEAGKASYLMNIPGLFDWGHVTGVVWSLKGSQGWFINICLALLQPLPSLVQRLVQTTQLWPAESRQPDRLLHSHYVIPTGVTF
jgi:hypothetical protein